MLARISQHAHVVERPAHTAGSCCILNRSAWVGHAERMLINQSINIFNVLGGNWDPTDKKFSSVNSYRQDLLPTCKTFPNETTTCIWFTQSHKVCNSTTVLQELQVL